MIDPQPYRSLAAAVVIRAICDLAMPCPGPQRPRPAWMPKARGKANEQYCEPGHVCDRCSAQRFLAKGAEPWATIAGLDGRIIAAKYLKHQLSPSAWKRRTASRIA